MPKNWCFELWCWKKLFNPLDWKEIQPVHPKGNQSWITTERTDAEAETIILWPPNAKNWLTGKNPDAGKDWRQEAKGTIEDKTVGRHHQLNGYEFKQAPGVGYGQGGLACCSPWGHKESDTTEWLKTKTLKGFKGGCRGQIWILRCVLQLLGGGWKEGGREGVKRDPSPRAAMAAAGTRGSPWKAVLRNPPENEWEKETS